MGGRYFSITFGKRTKNTPKIYLPRETEKKRKGLTKRGNSNMLAQGLFVRVLAVLVESKLIRGSAKLINRTPNPTEITCWGFSDWERKR